MRLLYQKFDNDTSQLDAKAGNILSSSSLILTLFGILQITLLHSSHSIIYQILLCSVFVLFLALVIFVLLAVTPQGYKTVFDENWDGVEKAILNKSNNREAIMQLIGNYLDRINFNKNINRQKAISLRKSTVLFAILMVLIVSLSLFGQR